MSLRFVLGTWPAVTDPRAPVESSQMTRARSVSFGRLPVGPMMRSSKMTFRSSIVTSHWRWVPAVSGPRPMPRSAV